MIDLYFFLPASLPIWIFTTTFGCGFIFCVKDYRLFTRVGLACLGCSLIVLILMGMIGNDLNKHSKADAVIAINKIENFRLEKGHYHNSNAEILSSSMGISKEKVKFRGRWFYALRENDDYFFAIETFSSGLVK